MTEPTPVPPRPAAYDAVIIGGGAAGLSAAVTLSRALRSVLVIDAGHPRNAPAQGVHGFLTRDGMSPQDLLETARSEAEGYGTVIRNGEAIRLAKIAGDFEVELADGDTVVGRRLLVATGLVDGLPPVPGLREQWGNGVVHCPYCHGYEIRGQRIGVLATGPLSVHQVLLFRQWSDDLTFFLNDSISPTDEEWEKLTARRIRVVDGPVISVDTTDGVLSGVTSASGTTFGLDALAVGTRMEARGDLLASLGVEMEQHPMGIGQLVPGGPMGSTAVPGVYVAGNVSNLSAQVIVAAAEGVMAGAAINADLIEEETASAVDGLRGSSDHGRTVITERITGSITDAPSTPEEIRRAG